VEQAKDFLANGADILDIRFYKTRKKKDEKK
jgi:hypothetical protein